MHSKFLKTFCVGEIKWSNFNVSNMVVSSIPANNAIITMMIKIQGICACSKKVYFCPTTLVAISKRVIMYSRRMMNKVSFVWCKVQKTKYISTERSIIKPQLSEQMTLPAKWLRSTHTHPTDRYEVVRCWMTR